VISVDGDAAAVDRDDGLMILPMPPTARVEAAARAAVASSAARWTLGGPSVGVRVSDAVEHANPLPALE
jgi:hypothetical protein